MNNLEASKINPALVFYLTPLYIIRPKRTETEDISCINVNNYKVSKHFYKNRTYDPLPPPPPPLINECLWEVFFSVERNGSKYFVRFTCKHLDQVHQSWRGVPDLLFQIFLLFKTCPAIKLFVGKCVLLYRSAARDSFSRQFSSLHLLTSFSRLILSSEKHHTLF